jgi:hypothetical protein
MKLNIPPPPPLPPRAQRWVLGFWLLALGVVIATMLWTR